jgi:tetratricopeptide (TPR) repeat protein
MDDMVLAFLIMVGAVLNQDAAVDGNHREQPAANKEQQAIKLNRRGLDHLNKGNYREAIEIFTQVIELMPSHVPYMNRGIARHEQNELDAAVSDFTTVIRVQPRLAAAYYLRGMVYRDKEAFKDAKADLNKAITLKPDFVDALNGRGLVHHALGDLDKALQDYNRCIAIAPKDHFPLTNRAIVWIDKEEYVKAIEDCSLALELAPDDATAALRRGYSRLKLRQYEHAHADLELSVTLDPLDPRCLGTLAEMLATCPDPNYRDSKRAVQLAKKSGEIDGWRDSVHFDILAAAYAEAGEFTAAVETQKKAIAIETEKEILVRYRKRLTLYQSERPARLP